MSRVLFNKENGTFFDYDSDKYITISGAKNFDKLDEEARQNVINELESMGYEYAPGDFEMLYEELDTQSVYGEQEEDIFVHEDEEPIASVIFNDDGQSPQAKPVNSVTVISDEGTFILGENGERVDLSSAYPDVNKCDFETTYPQVKECDDIFEIMKDLDICEDIVINHDNDVKKTKISHLLYEELRMPKEVAQYVELKLAEYRVYTISDSIIKQIWYDIKDDEEVAKRFIHAFLTIAVYNYYACLEVTYDDMTNDVMKLNREVMTNHKLDLMIIDILQRYPEEYDRAVIKFMEHFNYCCLHYRKFSHFISKREVLELLRNKYI